MNWRIVREYRGQCTVGFRVQEEVFGPARSEYFWTNRGRRVYTLEDARILKGMLIAMREMMKPEILTEFVE